jgi:hypothetical protein
VFWCLVVAFKTHWLAERNSFSCIRIPNKNKPHFAKKKMQSSLEQAKKNVEQTTVSVHAGMCDFLQNWIKTCIMSIGHDKIYILQCGGGICWCSTERPEESWLTNKERCCCPATTYISKFWDRACLVSSPSARRETPTPHPKQPLSSKLPFEMVVPPLSHFALKTERATFSRNVQKPARHDKPQMWILATNRCALLATTTDCSTVWGKALLWGKLRGVEDSVMRITSSRIK